MREPTRDFFEDRERLAQESDLDVEIRELRRNVTVSLLGGGKLRRNDLACLLVDCNRFVREAAVRIELANAVVRVDRVAEETLPRLKLTDLVKRARIIRIRLD